MIGQHRHEHAVQPLSVIVGGDVEFESHDQ
jgi:hypothetical protein